MDELEAAFIIDTGGEPWEEALDLAALKLREFATLRAELADARERLAEQDTYEEQGLARCRTLLGTQDVHGIMDGVEQLASRMQRAEADSRRLREALASYKCRCSKAIDDSCPDCGEKLSPVRNNGCLNDDQFDAIKAGDWYCETCPDASIRNGKKHWHDRELKTIIYQTCGRCAAIDAAGGQG